MRRWLSARRRKAIVFAGASTLCGAVFIGVVGQPDRFAFHYVGFVLFLTAIFGLGLYLYGRID